ncbi:MAG: galactokinase [Acidimicrobiales bacterium]|nr:galactokinase [Acidimicrobiales bacterium]
MSYSFRSFAPGRVNLIGEHTDYTGGLVFPMALDLGITITGRVIPGELRAKSNNQSEPVHLRLPVEDLATVSPSWGRFLAAVLNRVPDSTGLDVEISSSLPSGGTGLSTSTALSCAFVLPLATTPDRPDDIDRLQLAKLVKAAEQDATGVETGIMDQLASLFGVAGSALMIDCHDLAITPVVVPDELQILIVHSGQERELVGSEYSDRREACYAAQEQIGPLRLATLSDVATLKDPTVRRIATHVVGDNARVRLMAAAFEASDLDLAAQILTEGHRSYADNFGASTATVEAMVAHLIAQPGIRAARLTGGGFGGSIVAFAEPGAQPNVDTWWTAAAPSAGANISWISDA